MPVPSYRLYFSTASSCIHFLVLTSYIFLFSYSSQPLPTCYMLGRQWAYNYHSTLIHPPSVAIVSVLKDHLVQTPVFLYSCASRLCCCCGSVDSAVASLAIRSMASAGAAGARGASGAGQPGQAGLGGAANTAVEIQAVLDAMAAEDPR